MIRSPLLAILTVQAALIGCVVLCVIRLDSALNAHAQAERKAFAELSTVIRQTWYIHEQAIAGIEQREAREQPPAKACECLNH